MIEPSVTLILKDLKFNYWQFRKVKSRLGVFVKGFWSQALAKQSGEGTLD